MRKLLKSLNLTDEAIEFYLKLYGKNPLTLNEIQTINPDLSRKKLIELINLLFQSKLLMKINPKNSSILGHFLPVPPLFTVISIVEQIKTDLTSNEGMHTKMEAAIEDTFKNRSKIELEKIYKDFQILQRDVHQDIDTIKKELDDLLNEIEEKKKAPDFLKKYEKELQNMINTELASIVIILLHMKAEFQEKLKSVGISNDQWNSLKDEIKDTLAFGIHEKSEELGKIVSDEFEEIRNVIKENYDVLKDRFEQKSVYLGILNMFKNEIDKFHKALLLKKNNLNLDIKTLETQLSKEISEIYNKATTDTTTNIVFLETIFKEFFEKYKQFFQLDKLWQITSQAKINEEILNLLKKSKKEIIIIVPQIDNFIPLKPLEKYTEDIDMKIISSDSHESDIVKTITKNAKIHFENLKNKNFIGLKGDDSYLILGIFKDDEIDPLKNIFGFGTNDEQLIEMLSPILSDRVETAKPPNEIQMNRGFNFIIENINTIKGRKISKILQEILDVAYEMDGMSLDLLEIKVLISKLKNVNDILDLEAKQEVVSKIFELNEKVSKMELKIPPELTIPTIEKYEPDLVISDLKKGVKPENVETLLSMFELFSEKVDQIKGKELSKQIESMIDMIFKFQGYTNILEWKNNLKELDEYLQDPIKEKIREDFNHLKEDLLKPLQSVENTQKELKEPIQAVTNEPLEISAEIEDDYFSPALAEQEKEDNEEKTESVSGIFLQISQNIDTFSGAEISEKLQQIMDIILETKGYSIALKDMRQWISKLRMIKIPLVDDIKTTFKEKLSKWKKEAL
ncbi:MAG: hypothetical protein EU539_10740 [Promethearchaeota archaeon]|nr:MAG: hypothetical protein EU539_10740 [Candidatus Lokiarchaeota archaeon]